MGGRILTLAAINLVQEVEQAGGQLEVAGERLKIRAPTPLPRPLVDALRERKADVIDFLAARGREAAAAPDPAPARAATAATEWDAETAVHIAWFETTAPPAEFFELSPGVVIAHPDRAWISIKGDIAAGPGGPRAHYGALQNDLANLHALFGPKREADVDPASLDDDFGAA
jgi:hypothetical protein